MTEPFLLTAEAEGLSAEVDRLKSEVKALRLEVQLLESDCDPYAPCDACPRCVDALKAEVARLKAEFAPAPPAEAARLRASAAKLREADIQRQREAIALFVRELGDAKAFVETSRYSPASHALARSRLDVAVSRLTQKSKRRGGK